MATIHVLSADTINKIAAGEVVERPVNVVKELAENAIDAGASAVTVEIRNGGIDLIRVTDNGCGIEESQVRNAFRRHATSKIEDEKDLSRLSTLGFRGEALSSIAAVAQVEMITKTRESLVGVRATNQVLGTPKASADAADAGAASLQTTDIIPLDITEIGAPDGTSVIVRNLFYNVPVRRKFLKTAQTEAGYITDLMQQLALSHPDISFHYRVNNQDKLVTSGNGNEKELIYRIYGREMAASVIPVKLSDNDRYFLEGYLGRPEFSRSSRSYEIFFVNGRILHSDVLSKGLEMGYRTDLMQHRFPFAILHLELPAEEIDVNVHPSKMEVRFTEPKQIYDFLNEGVHATLHQIELIPRTTFGTQQEEDEAQAKETADREAALNSHPHTEQFEGRTLAAQGEAVPAPRIKEEGEKPAAEQTGPSQNPEHRSISYASSKDQFVQQEFVFEERRPFGKDQDADTAMTLRTADDAEENPANGSADAAAEEEAAASREFIANAAKEAGDTRLYEDYAESAYGPLKEHVLSKEHIGEWHIIGQVFKTYWIIEYQDKMLLIDQHAAHEKVNFERLMKRLAKEQQEPAASQLLSPPIILSLTGREEAAYLQYQDVFHRMGYEIEAFGDSSYAIRAVPLELYANEPDALLREVIDEILDEKMSGTPSAILYKIASMSCKAAVKGNTRLSPAEAQALIDELLSLDNPYHCPHGRPTMVVLSEKDLEKKFKRIV